jgi:SAM-dependent methyltransferase
VGVIGGTVGYQLLRAINPRGEDRNNGSAYTGRSKLAALFGPGIWDELAGRTVIDFGCGDGVEAVEMAQRGASRVIGLDIREPALARARERAARAGVAERCSFVTGTDERADVVLSMDSFEHFDRPDEVLAEFRRLLRDGGSAIVEFGPTWYHPRGGHLFSVFPWAHLVFTERALLRWRADFKSDGATRFHEVEGGLNQLTIRRFERLAAAAGFRVDRFEAVPIRRTGMLANAVTREFLTAIVRCRLSPR